MATGSRHPAPLCERDRGSLNSGAARLATESQARYLRLVHHGRLSIRKICATVLVAAASAACAGGETLRDGPPPPESCAAGEQLVCRATTTSPMQRRNGRFCSCRPAPGLP